MWGRGLLHAQDLYNYMLGFKGFNPPTRWKNAAEFGGFCKTWSAERASQRGPGGISIAVRARSMLSGDIP